MFRPHVVVLGAGASRATCPAGDGTGRILPLMADLVDVLGLRCRLTQWGINPSRNFEEIFSELHAQGREGQIAELQSVVEAYFEGIVLPENPTIYDHLILSLREHD